MSGSASVVPEGTLSFPDASIPALKRWAIFRRRRNAKQIPGRRSVATGEECYATRVRIGGLMRPMCMNNGNDFDFIIIGSGAGGGTLAYHLAPSGKKILLIERGPFVRREKENWNARAVNVEGRYNTKELWRNADGSELHPHTNYYVGGNTKFYGAALFRLREQDFGEIRHHGGLSPAWPI